MAGRGPLPTENPKRRNAPSIPTTALPVSGRVGPVPELPGWVVLGRSGHAWWEWAWATPQACAWDSGSHVLIARRASLEDDLAVADNERERLAILREVRELDDRLGLSPKGLAVLRWKIVADDTPVEATSKKGRYTHLRAVASETVASTRV